MPNPQITTLGSGLTVILEHEEKHAIVLGFVCTDETVKVGQIVKLNTDGSVTGVTATTDKAFGIVGSAYRTTDDTVRVYTPFVAVTQGEASSAAAIVAASPVACSGFDATTGLAIYKTAASGDTVIGICLVGQSASAVGLMVGIYRMPYLKP